MLFLPLIYKDALLIQIHHQALLAFRLEPGGQKPFKGWIFGEHDAPAIVCVRLGDQLPVCTSILRSPARRAASTAPAPVAHLSWRTVPGGVRKYPAMGRPRRESTIFASAKLITARFRPLKEATDPRR
jgi:hypothetical protein